MTQLQRRPKNVAISGGSIVTVYELHFLKRCCRNLKTCSNNRDFLEKVVT